MFDLRDGLARADLGPVVTLVRWAAPLFSGRLIELGRISVVAPLGGQVILGVPAVLLDWVMRDRAPPPWSVQVMRADAMLGRDGPVKFAAMAVPPAPVGGAPPPDPSAHRRSRLPVMIGAGLVLAAVALFLAVNGGGQ